MIVIKHKGNFNNTEKFLKRVNTLDLKHILEEYGKEGVKALSSATPVDTGLTANSWDYKVEIRKDIYRIYWSNTNVVNGVPVAIVLQYGHATKDGGFIQGRDYINPALQPIFDKIAEQVWKEVTK